MRQYMLDVDNRYASLQRMLTCDASGSLPASVAKHCVLKWNGSIGGAEVEGVMHDLMDGSDPAAGAQQLPRLSADVDIQRLLSVVRTTAPWLRLHPFYELDSTLQFVEQIHETDAGVPSRAELPEVA